MADNTVPIITRDVKATDVANLLQRIDDLLDALRIHPLMPNDPHDGRTPPQLFFTWDFAQRTRGNLSQIPVDKIEANDREALSMYSDCIGRCFMSKLIITDTTGKTAAMLGGPFDFGRGVKEAAEKAAEGGGGTGEGGPGEEGEE